jgi:hypothetical protein
MLSENLMLPSRGTKGNPHLTVSRVISAFCAIIAVAAQQGLYNGPGG